MTAVKALKHAISTKQFLNKPLIEKLSVRAKEFSEMPLADYPQTLKRLTIATMFFEPSTRTRLSFETAAQNLGAHIISCENANEFSSTKKGETLEDTILTLNAYADGIVLRHPAVGSARRAAKVSKVPVINAGDGAGDHPTQGLLDIYTIIKAKGTPNGLKIAMVGDLLYGRTLHSLLQLLALYKVEFYFIAPDSLQLPVKYRKILDQAKIPYTLLNKWDGVLRKVDVTYMTRVQKERFKFIEDYQAVKDSFILTMPHVKKKKKDAIIMHPLPRVNEIHPDVDADPRAVYFEQVKNGLYMRMALLEYLFAS
jgi:aspartate carbamoyltransferase catalytic subunit